METTKDLKSIFELKNEEALSKNLNKISTSYKKVKDIIDRTNAVMKRKPVIRTISNSTNSKQEVINGTRSTF